MGASTPVTRIEIAGCLEGAFGPDGRRGQELAELAADRGARHQLVATLEQLPSRSFWHLRELWEAMPDVPIGD